MKILITGATGLVGKKLSLSLLKKGHQLVVVGRDAEIKFREKFSYPCQYLNINELEPESLIGIDGVINLAGESIAGKRWTQERKNQLLNSRIQIIKKLENLFERINKWPQFFVGASAIGFYGNSQDHIVDENSAAGKGFLAEVCETWENAYSTFKLKSRLIVLRIGVVLSTEGGFLDQLEPLFDKGLGGAVGNGKQWLSWIHIDDLIRIIEYAIEQKEIKGVYNATAPEPVTNKEFTEKFSETLHNWAILPAPSLALKIVMGEMSQIALDSTRVSSEKIEATGFKFLHSQISSALKSLYNWKLDSQDQFFRSDLWIPHKIDEVFEFFSDIYNLERITPPWLSFQILNSSTPKIQKGTLINYKLKIHGVPQSWQTEITDWQPPHFFSDHQNSGPYNKWLHKHSFLSLNEGTLMTDEVNYRLPIGILGKLVAGPFVKNDVKSIFYYRNSKILDLFIKSR